MFNSEQGSSDAARHRTWHMPANASLEPHYSLWGQGVTIVPDTGTQPRRRMRFTPDLPAVGESINLDSKLKPSVEPKQDKT